MVEVHLQRLLADGFKLNQRRDEFDFRLFPLVILDEEGNSYKILAVAFDTDGEQLLVKIKV